MVTDLTLNRERIRSFKITNDENEFEVERSILPAGEMKFNNARHVENTLKYFFNMTEKYFNDETKYNSYIHNSYFYDGIEREKQYEKAVERYKDINFGKLQQELFYINFDAEDITDTDLKKIAMTIEDYYKKISERHRTDFKNMTYVFHFNQGVPHVHVICETVKR